MAIRPYAGGGAQAFQGDNQPLYVQNQNELKKAFNQVQASSISGAAPIGSVTMWAGTTANLPTTYAFCNGSSLSTTGTYAALFAVIGYRYGGFGPNFNLPDFHSTLNNPTGSVPVGISGAPTVPSTKTTSAAIVVDAHTHTVNSSLTATGAPNAGLALGINAGNANTHTHQGANLSAGTANTHTHAGGVLTQGNVDAHLHAIGGTTGNQSADHAHSNDSAGSAHSHLYFRPNTGANANTGLGNSDHAHVINQSVTTHTHSFLLNSANATATLNTSITAPGAPNAGLGMSVNAVAAPNAGLGIGIDSGNANTHTHLGSVLTAGNATTITASSPAHTHTTATTQIIFIIRVS